MGTITRYYSTSAVPGILGNPGGIGNSVSSIWLAATPQNYPTSYPFVLVLDGGTSSMEAVNVTAGNGTAASPWVVTRGYDGTLAVAHAPNAPVTHDSIGSDFAYSRAHEAADNTSATPPHGLPPTAWLASSFAVINETITPNATVTVQTWNSIPQTFAHLLVIAAGRGTYTGRTFIELQVTINGVTSARYSHITNQTYATPTLTGPSGQTLSSQVAWSSFLQMPASQIGSAVNTGGGFAILPNYTSTAFNKFALVMSGWGNGTDANVTQQLRTCFFNPSGSQSGINSLSLAASNGAFLTGSFFGLYGFGT